MGGVEVLEILHPGMLTTVQDIGRRGYGRYGVAPSGALDLFSVRIANLLVDNSEGEAVLEITLSGFRAHVLSEAALAVTGADMGLTCNGRDLRNWSSHRLKAGDIVALDDPKSGCRAYLSVGGGLEVPAVLGSKSTHLGTRFGGLQGRSLQAGDVLSARNPAAHLKSAGRRYEENCAPVYRGYTELRVVPGPQDHHFPEAGLDLFLNSIYRVSPRSDRTGIRLEGPPLKVKEGAAESIISEGVVSGAIQVPGDGQPIVILGETVTGGYRKIATVISADLHHLGQLVPGDRVRFQAVTLPEARQALWREEEKIARLRDSFF